MTGTTISNHETIGILLTSASQSPLTVTGNGSVIQRQYTGVNNQFYYAIAAAEIPAIITNAGTVIGAAYYEKGKYTAISEGIELGDGGTIINKSNGLIAGNFYGVSLDRLTAGQNFATLINYGLIDITPGSTRYGDAVGSQTNGLISNERSGTISGFQVGVYVHTYFATSSETVTNAGTIIGDTGNAVVFLGTGTDTMVIYPHAVFDGDVLGSSQATNILELASANGTGTLSGLGSQYVNFGNVIVDEGASWVMTGQPNKLGAKTTLTNYGSLKLSNYDLTEAGSLINTGVLLISQSTLSDTGVLLNNGQIVLDPSYLYADGLTGTGTTTIEANSTLSVQGAVSRGQTILFDGKSAQFDIGTIDAMSGTLSSFSAGDTIVLGRAAHSISFQNGKLDIAEGGGTTADVHFVGVEDGGQFQLSPDGTVITLEVACFLPGTGIRTPSGEVPVENLAAGDLVVTAGGRHRPLVWAGRGRAMVTRGRRSAATPVIIRKGALADNVPHRDLRVTKGHSLYLDGVLIPVEFLVNHRSILWDDMVREVTVHHLELETHDVLLANGVAAESYRDDDNRWLFQNADSAPERTPRLPFAPILTGGSMVGAVWRRLLDRAGPRPGVPTTDEPNVHLIVDGQRVEGTAESGGALLFRVKRRPGSVRVVSRTGVPAELGVARDDRVLGVALRRIVLRMGSRFRTIRPSDPRLTDGFHPFETGCGFRWTNGDAGLPAILFEGFTAPWELVLVIGGVTTYPLVDAGPKRAVG